MKPGDEKFLREPRVQPVPRTGPPVMTKKMGAPSLPTEIIPDVTDAHLENALLRHCETSSRQNAEELG